MAETQYLSAELLDIVAEFTLVSEQYREQSGVVLPPEDVGYGKPGVIMMPGKN